MLSTLAVAGYRSLRDIVLPLGPLTLVTGPNGSGKSSLYRALRLLADVAQGRAIQSLARDGGLPSTLWARPESLSRAMHRGEQPIQGTTRKQAVSLRLGFAGEEFGYAVDLGLPAPPPPPSAFSLDPEIKTEVLWAGVTLRPSTTLVERRAGVVRSRDDRGDWALLTHELSTFDSMMTHCTDPRQAPEMLMLREQMRGWRFYDHPGVHQHGLLRPLGSAELSDGTLRYILWVAALLTPRPPGMLVLNEPETSLHPDLLAPLGRLIAQAARSTQVVVVSHAPVLIETLTAIDYCHTITLSKTLGETAIAEATGLDRPAWKWPSR